MLEKVSDNHYRISGDLDIQNTDTLPELLSLGHSSHHHLILDCKELGSADSLLLAAVLSLARKIEGNQGTFTIRNFPHRLTGLAKTYGIDSLIAHYCATE